MNAVTADATRKIPWSVEGFRRFWAKPDAGIMHATGKHGPMQMTGIDRVRLRDGLVVENLIRFDSEEFERLSGCSMSG